MNSGAPEGLGSSCSTSDTRHVNLVTNPVKVMMRKEPGSVYEKWNISVVICDTAIPKRSTKSLLAATLYQPTISLEMPVPSQGHYGFHSFPVVD